MLGQNSPVLLPRIQFHVVQQFRAQPAWVVLVAASCLAAFGAIGWYWQTSLALNVVRSELESLQRKPQLAAVSSLLPRSQVEELPAFDGVALVQSINETAHDIQLPVDEVVYVLDDSANQPYLRYRFTLRVAAGYGSIKKFHERLVADSPNISLESINCSRQDIVTVPLSCDLVFSAFYRRGGHG